MAIGQEEIGRRIKQARDDADLTQQELADRIGVQTAQSISRYERGQTEVSTKRLRKIAEATGKELDYFVQLLPEEASDQVTPSELAALRAEVEEVREGVARVEALLRGGASRGGAASS